MQYTPSVAGIKRYAAITAVAVAVAVAVAWNPVSARADISKAWVAARRSMPDDAELVVGVDVAALQKTQLFSAVYLYAIQQNSPEFKMFETIQDICKIDLRTAIAGIVTVSDGQQNSATYLSLSPGIDEDKLLSCFQKVAGSITNGMTSVSIRHDGNIMQISGRGTVYLALIGPDVVVVQHDFTNKQKLTYWTGGHGAFAESRLGKLVEKVNTSAMVWFALEPSAHRRDRSPIGRMCGAFTLAGDRVDGVLHWSAKDASHAAKQASELRDRIADVGRTMRLAPKLADVISANTISSAGNEVTIETKVIESDLVAVLPLLAILSKLSSNK